jgi:xylose isomerase
MECASRGLGFYSYQASQEIIYQEHLAKSLTEKYATLSQQMDQLIHDANAQIKTLQDKIQRVYLTANRNTGPGKSNWYNRHAG